ncbi:MAG: DNA-binding protein WhiA [Aminivibrio sp.]
MIALKFSDFGKTLSSSMWDEWTAGPCGDGRGALEEIRGIVQGTGLIPETGEEARLSSGRLWIFRRLSRLWEAAGLSDRADFPSLLLIPKTLKGKVSIRLPGNLAFLADPSAGPPLSDKEGPRRLRGLWGACGALYIPKSGYYMSFRTPSAEVERVAADMLKKNGFSFGRRFIQGRFEITLRNQEEIVTLLARFGLSRTSLKMEEKAIVRSMKNRANMLVNCDSSNIRKTLEAASRQLELAQAAAGSPGFESLPEVLKSLILTRVSNPSATLCELGLLQSPPVSKSTVQYRWKKLEQIMGPLVAGRRGTLTHRMRKEAETK